MNKVCWLIRLSFGPENAKPLRHIIRRISVQSYFACGAGKQARITWGGVWEHACQGFFFVYVTITNTMYNSKLPRYY